MVWRYEYSEMPTLDINTVKDPGLNNTLRQMSRHAIKGRPRSLSNELKLTLQTLHDPSRNHEAIMPDNATTLTVYSFLNAFQHKDRVGRFDAITYREEMNILDQMVPGADFMFTSMERVYDASTKAWKFEPQGITRYLELQQPAVARIKVNQDEANGMYDCQLLYELDTNEGKILALPEEIS